MNSIGDRLRFYYLYSTEGQLLAELDAQGNTQREYLYLQSWPVAIVSYTPAVPAGSGTAALLAGDAAAETAEDYPEVAEPAPADPKPTTSTGVTTSGTSDRTADGVATSTAAATPAIQLHYLHPDHLGTPRLATDSTQRIVWRWDSAPFGDTPAQEDPDGDGVRVTLNLRFPGQYFDAETGLHYNYFRDYDPVVGRYLESDPIGLRGGVNTYGYAYQNPIQFIDLLGLDSGLATFPLKICCEPTTGDWKAAIARQLGYKHCYVQDYLHRTFEFATGRGATTFPPGRPFVPGTKCLYCIPKKKCNDDDPNNCAEKFTSAYGNPEYLAFSQNSNTFIGRLITDCCEPGLIGDWDDVFRGAEALGI